jgi:hypothetical protein
MHRRKPKNGDGPDGMERRLIPINAWIALHRGGGGWPAPLRGQGFRIHRLEAPVGTAKGTVVVDGISVKDTGVALATECKSGANVPREQAEKYAAMTCEDLARFVGLPFDHQNAVLQPMYACLHESQDRVRLGLDKAGLEAPLLVIGDSQVRLDAGPNDRVAPFTVDVSGPPPRYIAVDVDSSDQEFLEILIPELITAANRGDEFVSLTTVMGSVVPYWNVYGADAKKQLVSRAQQALAIAFAKHFPNDFRFEASGMKLDRGIIRVLARPGDFDPRGQTQSWQRLKRQASAALGRSPAKQPSPGQQVLFEDLGLSIEMGEP